ncbi:MAG TPA: sialidase family protein, partial [Opitutaceae bacterium]
MKIPPSLVGGPVAGPSVSLRLPVRALTLVSLASCLAFSTSAAPQFSLTDVWTPADQELDGDLSNGPEPHFVYAIGVTWDDSVLVACEGRLSHSGDGGAKYLLVKRSTDQGATWSSDIVIEGGDGWSWTNPAFVVDGATTYLFYSSTYTGTKTLHYKTSTDNGQTWSARQDINSLWGATFPNDWVQHGTIGHG